MELKYKVIEADRGIFKHIIKLKTPHVFNELREWCADAFYKGCTSIRLYPDYRKKKNYLCIDKGDFEPSYIEQSYYNIQKRNEIIRLNKIITNLRSQNEWNEKRISEIQKEIKELTP